MSGESVGRVHRERLGEHGIRKRRIAEGMGGAKEELLDTRRWKRPKWVCEGTPGSNVVEGPGGGARQISRGPTGGGDIGIVVEISAYRSAAMRMAQKMVVRPARMAGLRFRSKKA